MFRQGTYYKMHTKHHVPVTLEQVLAFVRVEHPHVKKQGKTPVRDPTIWQELEYLYTKEVDVKNGFIQQVLFMDEFNRPSYGGIIACYVFPCFAIVAFWFMMRSYFDNTTDYQRQYE